MCARAREDQWSVACVFLNHLLPYIWRNDLPPSTPFQLVLMVGLLWELSCLCLLALALKPDCRAPTKHVGGCWRSAHQSSACLQGLPAGPLCPEDDSPKAQTENE